MHGERRRARGGLVWSVCASFAFRVWGAELTPAQRATADAVVGAESAALQMRIALSTDLVGNIARLAERRTEFGGWQPAMRIGFCAKECRQFNLAIPPAINERVVEDIVWQFLNAPTNSATARRYHREECARALGFIGHSRGVPIVLKSLRDDRAHFSWQGIEALSDPRLIPAIESNLNFTVQQDAMPAIRCLARLGPPAIPTLRRFLDGADRALRAEAVDALVRIGAPECLPPLESLRAAGEPSLARKVAAGIARIRCRAVDKLYTPPTWPLDDENRLRRLVGAALSSPMADKRAAAADAVVRLGEPTIGPLREYLASQAHGDTGQGPVYHVTQRAAELLVRVGKPAIPALLDALCDEQEHARAAAAASLAKLTGQSIGPDYEKWRKALADKDRKPPPRKR
jgi:hypothetical protein